MDRFGPPFEVNHFSRLDRFDRNRPFHVFSMFYMEENAYHCSFFGLLTADLSVLLIHPCAVTTTLSHLQQRYRNKILTLVRCSKKSYYHSYFSDHMTNVRKTWIGINHLIGQNKRRFKPIVALPNVLNEFFPSVGQTFAGPPRHQYLLLLIISVIISLLLIHLVHSSSSQSLPWNSKTKFCFSLSTNHMAYTAVLFAY